MTRAFEREIENYLNRAKSQYRYTKTRAQAPRRTTHDSRKHSARLNSENTQPRLPLASRNSRARRNARHRTRQRGRLSFAVLRTLRIFSTLILHTFTRVLNLKRCPTLGRHLSHGTFTRIFLFRKSRLLRMIILNSGPTPHAPNL